MQSLLLTGSLTYLRFYYLAFFYIIFVIRKLINFMVTPCVNNIQHFNNQLTHTTLKT